MQAIYHTTIDELSTAFIEHLKQQFKSSKVDIIIKDYDDTDYLNSSATNKQYLEQAIEEVNQTKIIQKSMDDLGL